MIILEILIYLLVGLVVMIVGCFIIDLLVPVDFPKEIKAGNKAVAWVEAGIYTALGFIIRTAIISIELSEPISLKAGLIDTLIYSGVGLVALIIGYYAVDIVNRAFNIKEELKNKNEAAGIMIFGIFLGIAFIVSGVIQ
jgi:putative membrane protein